MAISTECQLLISEFAKLSSQVAALAKAPMGMVATLNGMIKNAALGALQTTDAMFNDLAAQLGITAIEDTLESIEAGLYSLKNCTALANNPLIQSVVGTDLASLNGASAIGDITGKARAYAQNQAKLNAMAALDKGMGAFGLGGQLGNTQMRYQQMLKSAGIIDSINLMQGITTCLTSMCSSFSGYQTTIDNHLSSMKLNPDQTVGNLWAGQTADAQSAINDTVARGKALEIRVTNWAGGLF